MTPPRAIVLRAAGINCDRETVQALELAGARVQAVHIRALQQDPTALAQAQILVIPGGFSFGDHIGAGRVLAVELRERLSDPLAAHLARGGLVLGICNGFQALVQLGLLPGGGARATLAANASGRFECRWVHLQVAGHADSPYFAEDLRIELPVAHGEGRLLFDREVALADRVHLRYVDAQGRPGPYPINPNGSPRDQAGIADPTGRVLGLMPHPERHVHAWQHPGHAAAPARGSKPDGLRLFERMVRWFS